LRDCEIAATVPTIESSVSDMDALVSCGPADFFGETDWEAVGQPKHNVLQQIRCVEMRQIST